jgi:hypothetical protein
LRKIIRVSQREVLTIRREKALHHRRMNTQFVFGLAIVVVVLQCGGGQKTTCSKPSSPIVAGCKVYPPVDGVQTLVNGSIFASCTSCGKGIAKYFFPGLNDTNSNNGNATPSISIVCSDWTKACIKAKSGVLFGIRGKNNIDGINVYTVCDTTAGKCLNYAQLVCDMTKFKANAGFYNQASGNAKWLCGDQQGSSGTSVAPAFGSQTSAPKYLKIVGISCKGCGKMRQTPCVGPLVCPTCNQV